MALKLLRTLGATLLAAPSLAQTTWVVDDNGTGDFVHVQDAVDVAQDGDVVFVLDGAYAGFTIDGRSLVVTAEPGAEVDVAAQVVVLNLAADQKVELEGLQIGETFSQPAPTVRLEDNAGSVRLVDCEVTGWGAKGDTDLEGDALECVASDEVGILRSTLQGGRADYYGPYGSLTGWSGLRAWQSTVLITDSTVRGGQGVVDFCLTSGTPPPGGPGAVLNDGTTVTASGSTFEGGAGAYDAGGLFCGQPESGPRGFSVSASSDSSFEHSSCTLFGHPTGPFSGPGAFAETRIAAYCFGTWEECPCGNQGAAGAGCETSYASGGVRLTATGEPLVSADTVTLHATGFNPNANPTGLFFQGDVAVGGGLGTPFNDGLLCAGGTVIRLKGRSAVGGAMSFGFDAPGASVSVKGALPPTGGTRTYQVWYRNQAPQWCTAERFNMSNGLAITWLP